MKRNLKALGLAFVAVFALSALAASGAQAAEGFNWASGTVKLTAEADATGGNQVFKTTAGTVECNIVTGSAVVSGTSSKTVTGENIKYSDTSKPVDECKGPLGSSPTIEMHNCHYTFNFTATSGPASAMEGVGTVTIEGCGSPGEITVNGGSVCKVHIPQGQTLGSLTYKDPSTVGTTDVTIEVNITNIHYSHEGLCGTGSGTTGTYTGNITVKGFDAGNNQTSVWVE